MNQSFQNIHFNDLQLSFSFLRVIVGAPKTDTSNFQAGVRNGGAVYRCDISDDNRCQIIHFDSNGELQNLLKTLTLTNQLTKAITQYRSIMIIIKRSHSPFDQNLCPHFRSHSYSAKQFSKQRKTKSDSRF